jgi:hypothetical protein
MTTRRPPSRKDVRASLRALAAAASDQQRAKAAGATLGLDKPERTRAKRPATAAAGASEAQVLNAVIGLLRHHPAVAWAHRLNVGAATYGEQFVRFGWLGAPDIIGQMRDGRILCVECKRERGGRISDAQQDFIYLVRKHGGVAGIVRSVDEAVLLLKYAGV